MPRSSRWSPDRLRPYAWYDAHLGGSASGITDASRWQRPPLSPVNNPVWLPYERPIVTTPVAGDYISRPAVHLTGDVEVIIRQRVGGPHPWTADGAYVIASELTVTDGWQFYKHSDGALYFQIIKADGFAQSWCANVATGEMAASPWIKLTGKPNDGGGVTGAVALSADGTVWIPFSSDTAAGVGGTPLATTGAVLALAVNSPLSLEYLRVNNGIGGSAVAEFDASQCGQTGYGPWSIFRSASGAKTVVQSPAANSARGMFLFDRTGDRYFLFPTVALPPTGGPFTAVVSARQWPTPGDFSFYFWSGTGGSTEASMAGLSFNSHSYAVIDDGPIRHEGFGPVMNWNERSVMSLAVDRPQSVYRINTATPVTYPTVFTGATGGPTNLVGGNSADFEFEAMLLFDRALSASEHAQLVSYYGGGL